MMADLELLGTMPEHSALYVNADTFSRMIDDLSVDDLQAKIDETNAILNNITRAVNRTDKISAENTKRIDGNVRTAYDSFIFATLAGGLYISGYLYDIYKNRNKDDSDEIANSEEMQEDADKMIRDAKRKKNEDEALALELDTARVESRISSLSKLSEQGPTTDRLLQLYNKKDQLELTLASAKRTYDEKSTAHTEALKKTSDLKKQTNPAATAEEIQINTTASNTAEQEKKKAKDDLDRAETELTNIKKEIDELEKKQKPQNDNKQNNGNNANGNQNKNKKNIDVLINELDAKLPNKNVKQTVNNWVNTNLKPILEKDDNLKLEGGKISKAIKTSIGSLNNSLYDTTDYSRSDQEFKNVVYTKIQNLTANKGLKIWSGTSDKDKQATKDTFYVTLKNHLSQN
jgi:hypothetical protein